MRRSETPTRTGSDSWPCRRRRPGRNTRRRRLGTKAAAAGQAAANAGKAVFEANCSGCHRFDIRVVGPPLNVAVPKYGGDPEKLKGFIRNPGKVNPDYPSMPKLGLPEEEIDAVAKYLIGQVQGGGSS